MYTVYIEIELCCHFNIIHHACAVLVTLVLFCTRGGALTNVCLIVVQSAYTSAG